MHACFHSIHINYLCQIVWNCCMHNKRMRLYLYGNLTKYGFSSFGFLWPFSLKTLLEESSPARAKQERLTVEFEGKSLRIRRSRKHHNRYWPCAQSQTSIRMSRGTGSSAVASQGLSRLFLKTFAAVFEPNWPPLGLRLSEDALQLVRCRKCN